MLLQDFYHCRFTDQMGQQALIVVLILIFSHICKSTCFNPCRFLCSHFKWDIYQQNQEQSFPDQNIIFRPLPPKCRSCGWMRSNSPWRLRCSGAGTLSFHWLSTLGPLSRFLKQLLGWCERFLWLTHWKKKLRD